MLSKGTAVRFTDKAICQMVPSQAKRFVNRTGLVKGYRLGACDPIVEFPKDGRRPAVTLFEVREQSLIATSSNL